MQTRKQLPRRTLLVIAVASSVLAFSVAVAAFAVFHYGLPDKWLPLFAFYGWRLSNQQGDGLERELISHPNNFRDRVELLGYYNNKRDTSTLTAEEIAARRKHILWVIANHPASAVAGDFVMEFYPKTEESDPQGLEDAKSLWMRQVDANPNDARILYNAGHFFFLIRELPSSESYLERARAIDPTAYDVTNSLATDYWHDARYAPNTNELRTMAIKASSMFDHTLENASGRDERRLVLPDAAQAAFEAGDYAKATAFSIEMLKIAEKPEQYRDYDDEIHYGNTVLGRIALMQSDTEGAASHLIKSGDIKGNPHLDTFGPNMMLAKELLERRDDKPVLTYLNSCATFWKNDDGKLAQWRSDISSGKMPDFGQNLHY